MKISPALPYPPQPPTGRGRDTVAAVRPVSRTRDALDPAVQRRPPEFTRDAAGRERAGHATGGLVHGAGQSARAARALASYADVAHDNERSALEDMLGFDAYA